MPLPGLPTSKRAATSTLNRFSSLDRRGNRSSCRKDEMFQAPTRITCLRLSLWESTPGGYHLCHPLPTLPHMKGGSRLRGPNVCLQGSCRLCSHKVLHFMQYLTVHNNISRKITSFTYLSFLFNNQYILHLLLLLQPLENQQANQHT